MQLNHLKHVGLSFIPQGIIGMFSRKYFFVLLFINTCFFGLSWSQKSPVNSPTLRSKYSQTVFSHLTEKEGLSDNKILDMVIDQEGILWIGTYTGLNRYDGKRFEQFTKSKVDSIGLNDNFVSCLALEKNGNIWIGTYQGLHLLDKKEYKIKAFTDLNQTEKSRISCIAVTEKGIIWMGSDIGLSRYDPEKKSFTYYKHNPADPNSLPDNKILKNGIAYDPQKKMLWIATPKGLCLFNPETGLTKSYRNTSDTLVYNNHAISALHRTAQGTLWFLDWNKKEIKGLDTKEEKILHNIHLDPFVQQAYGGYIFETSRHELWFSSNSYETVRFTYLNGISGEVVKHDERVSTSIPGDYVATMVEDNDKTIWLGTIAGIARFHPERQYYQIQKSTDTYPELKGNWQITCMEEDPKTGDQWIGARNDMVYCFQKKFGTWKTLDLKNKHQDKKEKYIMDIEFINDDIIFSFVNRLPLAYHLPTGKTRDFFDPKLLPPGYSTRLMTKETDSTYLLGNTLPIVRWNFLRNTFQKITVAVPPDVEDTFTDAGWLHSYINKGSWLAFSNQYIGYIHPGDSLIYPIKLTISPIHIASGYFNSLAVDHKGDVWFTFSGQGLFRAQKKKEKVMKNDEVIWTNWDMSDGVVNEVLLNLQEDKFGRMWCTSFNKFSVYDPAKNSFFNFKVPLGDHNSFYYNYLVPLKNGNILTNIQGELVTFMPASLKTIRPENKLIISTLIASGKKIFVEDKAEVSLEPQENFITFHFGSLSMQEDFQYELEYKLEDIQSSWVKADKEFSASYTDLSPGTYHFRLRMISKDGQWISEEKVLKVRIRVPFYNAWWFLGLTFVLASIVVGYLVRSRMNSIQNMNALRSKAQLLEKEKTTVMYENLKQHLNPHFLFNSLTSLSSLIRLDPKKAIDFLDKMSKVYRYILKNKDNETVPLSEELNFVNMYVQLQKTRFEEGFSVINSVTEDNLTRRIVPVTLQNLIENAIKHNTADEESPLVVEIFPEGDYIVVRNNLQKKNFVETSNKQGQQSMVSLYRFLSPLPVIIEESMDSYTVKIPFI